MSKVTNELKDDPLMPLRHTAEHVLHTVMQKMYPNLKKVMGPPIEDGFYMDFDLNYKVTPEDLPKIEAEMQKMIDANLPIVHNEVSPEEAKKLFAGNPYKLENIREIEFRGEKVSVYETGDPSSPYYDLDLCAGPHVKSTGEIKAFKLLSIAGAYYKGDEKNKMLQRIYGTAFDTQEALDQYLFNLEEAKKRDHRKLGKELDLFTFADEVGPGLPLWTPNGTIIREELEKWAKETEEKWGYKRVATPHIARHTLYELSGHLPYYKDDMYPAMSIEGEDYYLKGMNCPHHHMIYKSQIRSYRDLPLRLAEYGTVYRYEASGTLQGLMRVRSIAQNDAHIYCAVDEAEEEFYQSLKLYEYYYSTLGISRDNYFAYFGLPDPKKSAKYHGDKALWDKAEQITRSAMERFGMHYVEDIGGAAFYGPKIDIAIRSSIGKEYAISTAQTDLFMPIRFNLEYVDKDGSTKTPAVIHRAPLGSHERFIGFLIEHFGGNFPLWLSPKQIKVIPISEKNREYAQKVAGILKGKSLRVDMDDRDETMQAKIRDAQLKKIPYMLVVGAKEEAEDSVNVRLRDGTTPGMVKTLEFAQKAGEKYLTKALDLW